MPNPMKLFKALQRFGSYSLSATVLCYLVGFVITNLYLGSLGVVRLDLLRPRYVLAGLLFILFISAIAYLSNGLNNTLRHQKQETPAQQLGVAARYSVINLTFLYFALQAIALLAGSPTSPPVGIPELSPIIPWSTWYSTTLIVSLEQAIANYLAVLIALIILFAVIVVWNPADKNGVRLPRRTVIMSAFGETRQARLNSLGVLIGLFVLMCAWTISLGFIAFLVSSRASQSPTPSVAEIQYGWSRYLIAIVVIYLTFGCFITFTNVFPRESSHNSETARPRDSNPWIFFYSIAFGLILPAYALGIYPGIPQQVGGGLLLPISVTPSSAQLRDYFDDPSIDTYMIDRTPDSLLLYVVENKSQHRRIVDISTSVIESVTYYSSP